MKHQIVERSVGAKCTNSACPTDRIVDDLIECPDCGENKVEIEWSGPKQTTVNQPMSFVVVLHSHRRGAIISVHYVDEPSLMVNLLEQCSLDMDIHADISWVGNFAEFVKICDAAAGVDMDNSKLN